MLSTLMCICILVPGKHEHTGMLCAKCSDYINWGYWSIKLILLSSMSIWSNKIKIIF